ncbi:MAG TPA: hypothetical protein VM184_06155 [Gaiellaceae bacterium]|nr:hypothetical protein [Gaiellaceae bacterium]
MTHDAAVLGGGLAGLCLALQLRQADPGDLTRRLEVGPVVESATPSYQLDRGRFENELWRCCGDAGVELLDGLSHVWAATDAVPV